MKKSVYDPLTLEMFPDAPITAPRGGSGDPKLVCGVAGAAPVPTTKRHRTLRAPPIRDDEGGGVIDTAVAAPLVPGHPLSKLSRSEAGRIAGLASGKARQKHDEAKLLARWCEIGGGPHAATALIKEAGLSSSTVYRKLKIARNDLVNCS